MNKIYKFVIDNQEKEITNDSRKIESYGKVLESIAIGQTVKFIPFNHILDEKTDHKAKILDYHFVEYVMNAKEIEIHDSWNGNVRVVTKFFLDKL